MWPHVSGGGRDGKVRGHRSGDSQRSCHVTYLVGVSPTVKAVAYVTLAAGAVPLAVGKVLTAAVFTAAAIVLQNAHGTSNPTLTSGIK